MLPVTYNNAQKKLTPLKQKYQQDGIVHVRKNANKYGQSSLREKKQC